MGYTNVDKQREYQRQWVAKRRNKYFEDKYCVDCGKQETLELDHIDPTTKISNSIWSWSEKRRAEELIKCVIRCHTCHVTKTINHDMRRAIHGTRSKYDAGCRCVDCKEACRIYNKKWRQKRRAELKDVVSS